MVAFCFYEEKKQDIIGCPGELGNALLLKTETTLLGTASFHPNSVPSCPVTPVQKEAAPTGAETVQIPFQPPFAASIGQSRVQNAKIPQLPNQGEPEPAAPPRAAYSPIVSIHEENFETLMRLINKHCASPGPGPLDADVHKAMLKLKKWAESVRLKSKKNQSMLEYWNQIEPIYKNYLQLL